MQQPKTSPLPTSRDQWDEQSRSDVAKVLFPEDDLLTDAGGNTPGPYPVHSSSCSEDMPSAGQVTVPGVVLRS